MYEITRKLFLINAVVLAGCHSRTVETVIQPVSGPVELAYLARLYSMQISRVADRKMRLQNQYNTLDVEERGRTVSINGIKVWLHYSTEGSGARCKISATDFNKNIDPILRSAGYLKKEMPRVIVLDPGHGGKDPGTSGPSKVQEKTVVLDIAKRAQKLLESRGFKVYLTRTGDTYPELSERTAYAARVKADLFVSIHVNAAGASANGIETFVTAVEGAEITSREATDKFAQPNNKFDTSNALLGYLLQNNLIKASGQSDRGLRHARYSVIKKAPCPAALVECGFLSNPQEEELLSSASYRQKLAAGIGNAILGYSTLVKKTH
ncbi:MAG: N-acetylmuramoyl-L-alanine amidase [Pontiellaceae bacterium]|nr:N-acetylmuramoyl-L-alanine amidase [Pontiellaceae bacterium]